jgi:hypothetical protein
MFSVDLSTREWDGYVVALGGELDLVDAADAEAGLVTVSAREPRCPRQQTDEAGASPPRSRTAEPMAVKDGPALPSAARNMARRDPSAVVRFPGRGDDR